VVSREVYGRHISILRMLCVLSCMPVLLRAFALVLPSRPLPAHVDLLLGVVAPGARIPIPASKTFCWSKVVIELNAMTMFGRPTIDWGGHDDRQGNAPRPSHMPPSYPHLAVVFQNALSRALSKALRPIVVDVAQILNTLEALIWSQVMYESQIVKFLELGTGF